MLPENLNPLSALANNLWWSWDDEAASLFQEIDPWRWKRNRQNPVALLADIEPARLDTLSRDSTFLAKLTRVHSRFEAYLQESGWAPRTHEALQNRGIAYFSMEFGLHHSLRIYSGGLGVLAGDHLRSASDLGVPLVGVTLLYSRGYFRQVIDDGLQLDASVPARFERLPVQPCFDADGEPLTVCVQLFERQVVLKVWRLDVGRNRLYLLDADHDANVPQDRALTHHLYGGSNETRIAQEALLALGGLRALRLLDEHVDVYHLNEGHCAFVALELMRECLERGLDSEEALAWIRRRSVFTTHTPVPAGHDYFSWEVVENTLGAWRDSIGLPKGFFMDLGRVNPGDWSETLCMTVLALRTSSRANGVSALHGDVSREMWQSLWPEKSVENIPIGHITNGVHPVYWCAGPARAVWDEYVPGWRQEVWNPAVWARIDTVPAEVLWGLKNRLRADLVARVRDTTGLALDPHALTIGFARRFATYKRGDLIFSDPERLAAILGGDHPVQLIFAGKAHPRDEPGKAIIANVIRWANHLPFRNRVAFLEDYDMSLGHALTSGCDIWLNNPRRPREASGTSGQKVPLNGGINLSILDGWWPEAYDGTNGWSIGDGTNSDDVAERDLAEADSLYRRLEEEVLPKWSRRDNTGLPVAWIDMIRRSVKTCAPAFNSHRMVKDYVEQMYLPLIEDRLP